MDCSTPGFPVFHYCLPEPTQTHVLRVSDAIQPSHPLMSPSPPTLQLSPKSTTQGSAMLSLKMLREGPLRVSQHLGAPGVPACGCITQSLPQSSRGHRLSAPRPPCPLLFSEGQRSLYVGLWMRNVTSRLSKQRMLLHQAIGRCSSPLTVHPEGIQDGEKQETGPRWLACVSEE